MMTKEAALTLPRTTHLVVAALVALVLAPLPSDAGERSLAEGVAQIAAAASTAAVQLIGGDRAGAVGSLQSAADGAESLDPAEVLDAKVRKKFAKQVAKLRKKLAAGLRKMNDASVPALAAQRAMGATADAALDGLRILQRTDGGVLLEEIGATRAGFYEAGKSVLFRIQLGKDCAEEPEIAVVDESGGAVSTTFQEVRRDAAGNRVIRVTMGASGGAGRVVVTSCGVTRTWLLFNYGPKSGYPVAPKPEAIRFDGSWSGEFTGTATDKVGATSVFGPVEFTVSGGRVSISEPGDGAGSVSGTGRSRFSGGTGGLAGATYRFQGTFIEFVVGGTTASGNWTATYHGGRAHGRWSASRNGM